MGRRMGGEEGGWMTGGRTGVVIGRGGGMGVGGGKVGLNGLNRLGGDCFYEGVDLFDLRGELVDGCSH